jgi:ABC-type sugar transport system ATPase subunit
VLSLADRIVCLREGEITGDLDAADAGEEAVMARLVAEQVA